jgi:hypothetical protein
MSSPQRGRDRDRVIAARLTHVRVVRPLKAGPGGRTGRDGAVPGSHADDPARTVSSRWPRTSVPARCMRTRLPAQRCLRPAQSLYPSWIRTIAATTVIRPAQPARSPGAVAARQHQAPTEPISELGTHAADPGQHAGADQERPAAVTAATAKTPLQITCPRRSPGPAAVTAKTPKMGLEITSVRSGVSSGSGAFVVVLVNEF